MVRQAAKPSILWTQVLALGGMQAAITLTWVIYNLYLNQLLAEFSFSASLATQLLVLENLLGVGMEPLMGSFSDRTQCWLGSRFPLIVFGVILASGLFIAIPTIALWGKIWNGLLPAVLVAWALAMTVFRSPVLSLLGRYALATQLPQAASLLTLFGGLSAAIGPLANRWILSLGPELTFAIGSLVLLLAAGLLQKVENAPVTAALISQTETNQGSLVPSSLLLLFGTGLGIGFGFRLMMEHLPQMLQLQLPGVESGWMLAGVFLSLAIAALPAGSLAARWGNRPTMLVGLLVLVISLSLLLTGMGWLAAGITLLLGACLSLVINGTLPFALSVVPPRWAGLGTGMYFGGAALGNSLFGFLLLQFGRLTPGTGILLAIGGFLAAGLCIACSRNSPG